MFCGKITRGLRAGDPKGEVVMLAQFLSTVCPSLPECPDVRDFR